MDNKKQQKENDGSTWRPYVAGAATGIVAGPYAGIGVFGALKYYEKRQNETKQNAESAQSQGPTNKP